MYTLYNVQEKVRAYTHTGRGIKCDAKGAVSLTSHRDIWLQIYCRGLERLLIPLLRVYPPQFVQAPLSLTFTMQGFDSLQLPLLWLVKRILTIIFLLLNYRWWDDLTPWGIR